MLRNQAICMAERILGPKHKNHAVKKFEMTESNYRFYGCLNTIAQFSQ